jgi:signal transduction histidine kinase
MHLIRSISEQKLSWFIRFLLGTSLLLIIGLSYSYHTINKELIYFSEKVNRTQSVLTALEATSSGAYEATFLINNYLFLRDSTYSNKSLAALSRLPALLDNLDSLASENIVQKKRVYLLRGYFGQLIKLSESVLRTEASPADPSLLYATGKTLDLTATSIKKVVSDMTITENLLMTNRTQSRENYGRQIFAYNWIIMLVAIIFLSSAFVLLDRELTRNRFYRIDLENKIESLNRSNSELEQFAYVASHDMQEPLRKIRSFADRIIIKYQKEITDDVFQMLLKIDRSAQRMQMVINDLLAFSRTVNSGSGPKKISLSVPYSDAVANLSEIIRDSQAVIHCDPLPVMEVYPTQIVQLFQNLLSNSIKYRNENHKPVIYIRHELVQGEVIPNVKPGHRDVAFHQIVIQDNGIGFPKEFAEKIFVIFQRLHDRNKFHGTGIGLAICKRVISNHNGYIYADSINGEGASFYIYLPEQSLLG